ncbi:MAG TPA: hypothetical protein PLF42_05280 [Anaerolineales bacterium]|nr:hypothetical protein [Anaerolineales bacterium]
MAFFCFAAGLVTVWGYALSESNVLGQLSAWLYVSLGTLLVLMVIAHVRGTRLDVMPVVLTAREAVRGVFQLVAVQGVFIKSVLAVLAVFSVTAGILNLLLVVMVPPHSWDGITFHLPRMAQFIQNNNLASYHSPNWAQVVHPKVFTLLFLYLYLAFGNNENMTQFAQYASYWVFVASVYGISRRMGAQTLPSLFAALVASLLISGLAQANSNVNDMIMAALFGTVVYFLFTFRETGMPKYLVLASLGMGLVIGVKASALSVIPSIGLIAIVAAWARGNWGKWIKNLLLFQSAVLVAVFVFAVPSGYVENYRVFGNFLGDREVREVHSFLGKPMDYMIKGSIYNLFRYGLNFLSLDGLPPIQPVLTVQKALHSLPLTLLSQAGMDLEDPVATTYFPYDNNRPPSFTESAYWGILGFGMVWLSTVRSLLSPRKDPDQFVMALGAVVFLLGVAFSGPYDSSRGRYFSICAVFAAPLVAGWLNDRRRLVQVYMLLVVLIGGMSAVSAVVLKTMPRTPDQANLLQMDRLGQLTFFNDAYHRPMVRFEARVPKDAVVAVYFFPNTFEYPLYGRYLTRRIIPINSFYLGGQPIPDEAEYLLYARGYACARDDDIGLGADWFLRVLDDDNRECEGE